MAVPLAHPYAKAVFALACEAKCAQPWSRRLALMAALVGVPDMARAIAAPALARSGVLDALIELGGEAFDAPARNLLRLLAAKGRLALLPEIAARFEAMRAAAEGRRSAEVTSARPLADAEAEALRRALGRRLGAEIELSWRIDPGLIAGWVVRVGDLEFDGSVAGRLDRLAQWLA